LLSALLSRLELLRVNTVIIDPFTADRRRAFFSNSQMPVAANVLNRLLHQLASRLQVYHQVLRLPAGFPVKDWRALYTELARLNRFSGVLIDGETDARDKAAMVDLLRYYHPDLRIGVPATPDGSEKADFALLELDPGLDEQAMAQQARAHAARYPRAWVQLQAREPVTEERLISAMRLLREAGIVHYGIGPGAMPDSPASLLRLAPGLMTHTITTGEGG
jgi:hypothetical protein